MIVISKINLDKCIKNDPPFKEKFNQLPNPGVGNEKYQQSILRFIKLRSSHQRCTIKRGVLRNFTKFTGVFL